MLQGARRAAPRRAGPDKIKRGRAAMTFSTQYAIGWPRQDIELYIADAEIGSPFFRRADDGMD
jgi:hypothetical protein